MESCDGPPVSACHRGGREHRSLLSKGETSARCAEGQDPQLQLQIRRVGDPKDRLRELRGEMMSDQQPVAKARLRAFPVFQQKGAGQALVSHPGRQ